MSKPSAKSAVRAALHTLNSVTVELINGTSEKHLIQRYHGQPIVPGVYIRQYLRELQSSGCIYIKENKMFLKDVCNPARFLAAA